MTSLFCLPLGAQGNPQFFPMRDVRPGLRGVGRTIFSADKIQEFQVELIGVLPNVLAPKQSLILARLSGPTIQETGVVAGMSGSPVYINGKLLGAVAQAFPYAKQAYTLITPIEDMLSVVPQPAMEHSRVAMALPWYSAPPVSPGGAPGRWIPTVAPGPTSWAKTLAGFATRGSLASLDLPMEFGGFDPQVISAYTPLFKEMGLRPEGSAVLASAGNLNETPSISDVNSVTPGSMISVVLVRGDLNVDLGCTVTYRQGNNIYACGHQLFLLGPAQLPLALAHVLATVPMLDVSQKIDATGPVVGSIRQDRFGGIYGVLGEKPPVIPVHIHLASSLNRTTNYDFEVAQQALLSPILVNMTVVSALSASERMMGPSTMDLNGTIDLSGGEVVKLEDVISSDISSAGMAGAEVATPLSYLLDGQFPRLRIRDIDLNITSQDESRVATIEQVWSTRSEVRPGDHIAVTVVERTPSGGELTQTIPVEIPQAINNKTLSLVVGSGEALNALELRFIRPGAPPKNLHELVRELNRTRRNNRVYALLMAPQRSFEMEGTDFPSPPPSLLQTFLADPAISSKISYRASSVVGDSATKPLPYAVRGEQTLYLKVLGVTR
ncbi:MAG: SpoIVB peptidase S55 domain-containing protein [Terriglobia bacterium]